LNETFATLVRRLAGRLPVPVFPTPMMYGKGPDPDEGRKIVELCNAVIPFRVTFTVSVP
jgi:hypothetical protein